MFKLLRYLKKYKKESILSPLFKLLEASIELIVPLIVKYIIDEGIKYNNTNLVIKCSILLIVLALVGLAFSITAQYFAAKAAIMFSTSIKHHLFEHIETLSYKEIDTLGTNSLITRMTSDVNQVQNGVNMTLRLLLRSPFIVLGATIMALVVDYKMALIFLVTVSLLSIVIFIIMKITSPLYKKVQQKLDKVLKSTRENLTGVRVIRAFTKEDSEREAFFNKNNDLYVNQKKVSNISSLLNPLTYVIINIAIILLIQFGAIRVNEGAITQGAVIAIYNYMSQILVELIKFANLIITISKAIACGNRIQSVFEINSSINDGNINTPNENNAEIITFNNVYLNYNNGEDDSLSNINFSVKSGETIGVIGGTGSGKTSLVNLIPRFYDVTNGEVLLYGKNVKDYNLEKLRDLVGIVPQKAVLFKGSIRDNMKWGNENASDEEIYEALKISKSLDVVLNKEGKLDYEISQNGKNLSGGQRQRLTIARALVKKPKILILDDSSSALDYQTDLALRKEISALKNKLTVFIVSQRTSSLLLCDKIICLDNGKVMGIGSHEELLNSCEVYKEIYYSQYKGGNK
ncbi:MAG: ABC transporter ATP-binding protein [Candidatus Caccosoma sp.]|nr:ABC transporter ATP-binding protein [Candidatus Caccosoma sp.]